MSIVKCMDDKYIKISNNMQFYHWGRGCLACYYSVTIAKLDEVETAIVQLSDGGHTIRSVRERLLSMGVTTESAYAKIQLLVEKGIVKLIECEKRVDVCLFGEQGKYFPKDIAIELTNICNFRCPFCYKMASKNGEYISDETMFEIHRIVSGKVRDVLFTGGEPTLHPHFFQYVELFSKFARISVVSNGSILFKEDDPRLSMISHVQFSLYGNNDLEYKDRTGVANGFTRLKKSIKMLQKHAVPYSIAVTLNKDTIDEIEAFIKTAIELKSRIIKIGAADIFGNELLNYEYDADYLFKKENLHKTLLQYKKKYREKINVKVSNITADEIDYYAQKNKGCSTCQELSCKSGVESLVISQSGEIRACQYLPEEFFNIGGLDVLEKQITGDFKCDEFCKCVKEYYDSTRSIGSDFFPCNALEDYYRRFIEE